jgi:hypothetical protein
MTTSDECCGWLGWAELAGIGADGARLKNDLAGEASPSAVATTAHGVSGITAVLRRALLDRSRAVRPR